MAIDKLITQPLVAYGPGRAILSGRFAPNAASQPTGIVGEYNFGANRTAVGKWTCTFDIPAESTLLGAYVSGNDAASSDRLYRITGMAYNAGASPVQIIVAATVYSTAAAVDPAAAATTLIWVQLHVKLPVAADGSGL